MELVFFFVLVSLIFVKVIYGEENGCTVLKTGSCIHTIHVSITSDLKTFTVLNRNSSENNEITAVCDWIGKNLSCETKTGINHNPVSITKHSFSPKSGVACLDGNFTLKADGYRDFACIEKSDKNELEQSGSESNTDNKEQTATGCRDRRESAADDNKHRGKRSVAVMCDYRPLQTEKSVNVVAIASISVPVILVAVAVAVAVAVHVFWRKRRAFMKTTKKFTSDSPYVTKSLLKNKAEPLSEEDDI